jgi:hypothetical protein
MRTRLSKFLVATAAALLLTSAPAAAATIDGSPLTINDFGEGSFSTERSDYTWLQGRLQILLPGTRVYGSLGTPFTDVSSTGPTGTSPAVVTSTYTADDNAAPILEVLQTIKYTPGQQSFTVEHAIKNVSGGTVQVVPKLVANLSLGGGFGGFGVTDPFKGAVNWTSAGYAGVESLLAPVPPAIQEGDQEVIETKAGNSADASGDFTSSVEAGFTDAALGVQTGTFAAPLSLAAGETVTIENRFHLAQMLRITPTSGSQTRGGTKNVTATVADIEGNPRSAGYGRLRYRIIGANGTGQVNTATVAGGGTATISWTGTNAGNDQLSVWDDLDDDSVLDSSEPQQSASFHWSTPPVPPDPPDSMAAALNGQGGLVAGASWLVAPPGTEDVGPADKVWTGALGGFPTAGDSFAVMSSGNADAAAAGVSGGSGVQGNDARGAHDVSVLRVDLNVPADARCLAVNFKFLTDESLGSSFNDAFIAELDASDWTVAPNEETGTNELKTPRNFAFDSAGRVVSVKSADAAEMKPEHAQGTGYQYATQILQASTPITPGTHSVYFSILDYGDSIVDSAAFIDSLRTGTAACATGAGVPQSIDRPADPPPSDPPPSDPPPENKTIDELPDPKLGQIANADVAKGTILIKVPGTNRFVELSDASQIPIGSLIDATKGTIELEMGAGPNKKASSGLFGGSQFRLGQTKKSPLTTLSMTGGGLNKCKTAVPKGGSPKPVQAAAKRKRRLFSNAHGRFRTRGRNSSATVRGTQWTMTDTCQGTLTAVKQGSVVVHDFRLRKNRTLKTGQKYLARSFKKRQRRGP